MKNIHITITIAALLAAMVYSGCQKSESPPGYTIQMVTANISGVILDEHKVPVNGATVKAGTSTITTDATGQFTISNASLDKNAGMVKVEKAGYFTGIKTIVVTPNTDNKVSLQLIKKQAAGNFGGSTGGSITVPDNGGTIAFPANGVINATTNTSYTGTVYVSAFFINPEAPNFEAINPGTLRGINTANQETGLQSFGMMAVELNGDNGEKLQLASGKTATLTFPIPASLQAQAPSTIPLWSLDETTGLWKEEGKATRQGNTYVGTVTHFSFWNCDAPFNVVDFTATIQTTQNTPLAEARVVLTALNGTDTSTGLSTSGITNAEGVVSGKIPSNRNLKLKVYDKCGTLLYTQNIGPYTAATNMGIVTVTSGAQQITLSGIVINCQAAAVTNGYVTIQLEGMYYRANVLNGAFNLSINRCSNAPTTASLVAYDLVGNQSGTATQVAVSGNTINAGTLAACGISLTQYINFTIDGTSYSYLEQDSLICYHFPQVQQTALSGMRTTGPNDNSFVDLSFDGAEGILGATRLNYVYVKNNKTLYSVIRPITVNVVEYGASMNGFVAGNFSGNVKDTATSIIYPVTCTFRVKRSN